MIKFLYANGDSYGFGAELGYADPHTFDDYRRKHCYSGIIADNFKTEGYMNNSCPGGSNERIYRCLITDIPKILENYNPEEIFCVLSLSSAARREFCDNFGNYMLFMPHFKPAPPNKNVHMNDLWEILVKDFNHDSGIYLYNYMIISAIKNFLKSLKIPYIMTYSMLHDFEKQIENNYITEKQIDLLYNTPRIYREKSFSVYSDEHFCKKGPDTHPLEEGHQIWSKFITEYIEKYNLSNNKDL